MSGSAPPPLSKSKKRLILFATILGSAMGWLDGTVVNVALPQIQRALHAGAAEVQWVMNAYLLFLGALLLLGGAAGDRYGRRRVFLTGVVIFTLASIACALSPDARLLVVARAVQGIGAALLTPASLALLSANFPDNERGQAIGLWAGLGAVTAAAGPLVGGWLVDQVSWRAIFFINVPLAVGTIVLTLVATPESRDPGAKHLDAPGAVLCAVSLGLLTWGLTVAGSQGFHSMWVLAVIAAGVLGGALFALVEARSKSPMLPFALFKSRDFLATNLLTLLLYFALSGALFFLPFELIRIHGYPAAAAGAAILPFPLVMGALSSLTGRLSDRIGPRWFLAAGPVIAGAGLALLGWAAGQSSYWTGVFPAVLTIAIGMTLAVAPLTTTVMSSVPQEHAGAASGINNAVSRIAGLLAIAAMSLIFSAVFDHVLQPLLDALHTPAELRPPRGSALTVDFGGHGDVMFKSSERSAFHRAYTLVMLLAGGCAAAGGVLAGVFVKDRKAQVDKVQGGKAPEGGASDH
ncbi:MAG TPA: MFS transporter [Caulobacteraceae bacterium]|nr:MFS transporter [Caulobacteraceae bacterium]